MAFICESVPIVVIHPGEFERVGRIDTTPPVLTVSQLSDALVGEARPYNVSESVFIHRHTRAGHNRAGARYY